MTRYDVLDRIAEIEAKAPLTAELRRELDRLESRLERLDEAEYEQAAMGSLGDGCW